MVMKRLSYKQQWLGEISQNIMAGILMGLALLCSYSLLIYCSYQSYDRVNELWINDAIH